MSDKEQSETPQTEEVTQETAGASEPEIMTQEEVDEMESEEEVETAEASETPDEETSGEGAANDDAEAEDAEAEPAETDWREAYVRLAADFDNYRKRTSKEHEDVRRRERERVVGMWLDVYDNAERAINSLPEKEGPWYEGFSSLVMQMDKCLAQLSIHAADDMGRPFDPKYHEAIATCPNPEMENNTIMHVERRGFVYENGDVARVARVIVVRNPS